KQNDPIFDQYAVHAWFDGVERGQGPTADYIHIFFLPVERGWAWQIPITSTRTSIGIVTERSEFKKFKAQDNDFFAHYARSNDALARAMKDAVQVTPFKSDGDYSYSMEQFVGDGWIMVGDAARFVDPIFSSGVNIALYSAKFSSEVIKRSLEVGDVSRSALQPYEDRLRAGVEIWYEFIRLYYKLLPLFTLFIRSPDYRQEIHRLLQGEVYNRQEVGVLDAMRRYIETVEATAGHLLRGQLTDIPIDDLPVP
ncbi:MAG: tryptophan 7-halogenase, partial [Anaerolineales bacterium]